MRLIPTDPDHLLHAHTVDAAVQAFFAGLSSWRERHTMDPNAKPPRRRKWYFKVEYKSSAIRLQESLLILSNGRENAPLVLFWEWDLPKTVVIHWTGRKSRSPCDLPDRARPPGGRGGIPARTAS
jgi:putative transposase